MLQAIHEKIHGWVSWFVIILIALTFVLFGANYFVSGQSGSQTKAMVDGSPISINAFQEAYRRQRTLLQQGWSAERLKAYVLKQLVHQKILWNAAHTNGFSVAKQQAEQALLNIPEFQEDGRFSLVKFRQVLSATNYTEDALVNQIQDGMLTDQMRFVFLGSTFALPQDVTKYVKFLNQKRSYRYVLIDNKDFIKDVPVSKPLLQAYYDAHKSNYMTEESVILNYIELSQDIVKKHVTVTDSDMRQFYEENLATFTVPAQYKIAHILLEKPKKEGKDTQKFAQQLQQKIKAGTSIALLAKKHSLDVFSPGGVLPWVTKATMPKPMLSVVPLLKVNQVSEPFMTPEGIEIIQLQAVRAAKVTPFESVKARIKASISKERIQQEYAKLADELTDLVYQNPDGLLQVSDALNLPVHTTAPITRRASEVSTTLSGEKKIRQAAFSSSVLEGENSQPIQLAGGKIVVVHLKSHQKPQFLSYKNVQKQVKEDYLAVQSQKKAQSFLKDLQAALQAHQTEKLASQLKSHKLQWHVVKGQKRADTHMGSADEALINRQAFALKTVHDKPSRIVPLSIYASALLQLLSISSHEPKQMSEEEREGIAHELNAVSGMSLYELYVKHLTTTAKVTLS